VIASGRKSSEKNLQTMVLLKFALVIAMASSTLAAITCLKVGVTARATWENSAGKTCTWSGAVGSNFGPNPSGSGEYAPPARPVLTD